MRAGQKSIRAGVEDFLCPFTDMYITQGSNMKPTHQGIYANDVRGLKSGIRYPYYAPCKVKCIKVYKPSGQVMWQSLDKVRFANGRIDYATFITVHDDTLNAYPGMIINQGEQLGNMGKKGYATGVHCHIQVSQSKDVEFRKNKYGIYCFNNEYELSDCYFIDGTNIIYGMNYNWKKLEDVSVDYKPSNKQYINLPASVSTWRFYNINVLPVKKNALGFLKPKKFGGLSYLIQEYRDYNTTVVINSVDYGKVKIYISETPAVISGTPMYQHGNFN